ncbi:hypothetical protein ABZU94_07235 [Streptomyces mirabilis]|uniref:hypothetical protein n=1 Tax=Streptomyces sp. NPDC005388 TaxID=3156717 RepID=UPI0033AA4A92
MTNQPCSSYPDPWAQARRIAEQWEEAGRGVDRPTQVARVKAARARRAAVVSEARIKAAVDTAVQEELRRVLPQVAPLITEVAPQQRSPIAEEASPPGVPPVPDKPLHEMTAEEWDAHRRSFWQAAMPSRARTLTISDLTGRYAEDEA